MRCAVEVLKGDKEASKRITETLKSDQEAFEGNRKALKDNGEGRLKERRSGAKARQGVKR